jgi:SAM-dependent methyltransferase
MKKLYDAAFYAALDRDSRPSATRVLETLLPLLPPVRSAIDLGCGVGTWLAALRDLGVQNVLGIEGPWVDPSAVVIPPAQFQAGDVLTVSFPQRFDLAISLEVGEHLPATESDRYVSQLTQASDTILFSAAIPGQGGVGHVNEQWPDYWVAKFAAQGYAVHDVLRPSLWKDRQVAAHYRQNLLLFSKHPLPGANGHAGPLAIVHPDLFQTKVFGYENPTISQAARVFGRAIRRKF